MLQNHVCSFPFIITVQHNQYLLFKESAGQSEVQHFYFNLQKSPVAPSEIYTRDGKYLPPAISKDNWPNVLRWCSQGMEFLKPGLTALPSHSAAPLLSLQQQKGQERKSEM